MKPFNLEEALAGKYCITRCGRKVRLLANTAGTDYETDLPLVGVVYYETTKEFNQWRLNGHILKSNTPHDNDLVGMWEEPRPEVTITIPAPLKEAGKTQEVWHYGFNETEYVLNPTCEHIYNLKFKPTLYFHQYLLETGQFFKTKEDCQAFLEAMKGARR